MTILLDKQCVDWGDSIRRQADAFYDHQIQSTKDLIQEAIDSGLDPKAVVLENGIAIVDYQKLLINTVDAKSAAYTEADRRVQTCKTSAAPDWLGDIQKTLDFAMAVALLPYIELTKQYAAVKVDLGEIYKGRTFGGDNAFLPKVREEVLNTLGIGGDVAAFIKDPVNAVRDAITDVISKGIPITINSPNLPAPNIPGVRLW